MSTCSAPVVEPAPEGATGYTKVTFSPDLTRTCHPCALRWWMHGHEIHPRRIVYMCVCVCASRARVFHLPLLSGFNLPCIDDGTVAIMHRRLYDVAGTAKAGTTVLLNGNTVPVSGFQSYMTLFPAAKTSDDSADDAATAGGSSSSSSDAPRDVPEVAYHQHNKWWETGVMVMPDASFQSVSFVNGIHTSRGGTHVAAVTDALLKKLLPYIAKKTEGTNVFVCAYLRRGEDWRGCCCNRWVLTFLC